MCVCVSRTVASSPLRWNLLQDTISNRHTLTFFINFPSGASITDTLLASLIFAAHTEPSSVSMSPCHALLLSSSSLFVSVASDTA